MSEGALQKKIWELMNITQLPIVVAMYDATMVVERKLMSSGFGQFQGMGKLQGGTQFL